MHVLSRHALGGATLAASLALTAAHAAAQVGGVNPLGFGVSAGAAIPTGDAGKVLKTGYSVDGIVTVRMPTLPVSLRGEVGYTRFDVKSGLLGNGDQANLRFISGVVNLVYTFSAGPTAVVRPYLIGGVGLYNSRGSATSGGVTTTSQTQNDLGLNGGVGFEIPLSGITGFGEVRYTSISTGGSNSRVRTNFVPIRFGIRF